MTKNNSLPRSKARTGVPPLITKILQQRGITGEEAVRKFLFPHLGDLPSPQSMQNLMAAAELVCQCIRSQENIIIWGDYDVDGTTGTALLVNFFKEIGHNVHYHIPNRLKEGYGLNLDWFKEQGGPLLGDSFLLITVDCGISNSSEIAAIQRLGGKVIITDHHAIPEQGLPACLVLNPSQSSCGFNTHHLAGVGVAFYLAAGIRAQLSITTEYHGIKAVNLKRYLAFVALGTLADMVELTPTNRILVRAGIEALMATEFVGLQQLLSVCDISNGAIPSEDIGFTLGPKINAAGRLGDSRVVVDLLTTENPKIAKKLAHQLLDLNRKRRRITEENLEIALNSVGPTIAATNRCAIIQGELHQGVVGIVASKIVELYTVPALVFARIESAEGQVHYTGSARSVEGISIIEILEQCSMWLDKYGGHEMAAGLTVTENNFKGFSEHISSLLGRAMADRPRLVNSSQIAASCPVETLMSEEMLHYLQLLEPFGPGNKQPFFEDPAVKIIDTKSVGRSHEHLQVMIRTPYSQLKGIGFNLGDRRADIQQQPVRRMVYTPTLNRYRGTVSWQIRIIDL